MCVIIINKRVRNVKFLDQSDPAIPSPFKYVSGFQLPLMNKTANCISPDIRHIFGIFIAHKNKTLYSHIQNFKQ